MVIPKIGATIIGKQLNTIFKRRIRLHMIHEITLKKSRRRSNWQIKGYDHEIYDLTGMESIILRLLKELNAHPNNREQVYLLKLSSEPFDGYQIELLKEEEEAWITGTACFYTTGNLTFTSGEFSSRVSMSPAFHLMMKEWPPRLYLSMEKTEKRIMIKI